MRTKLICFLVLLAVFGCGDILHQRISSANAADVEIRRDLTYEAKDGFVDILKDGKLVARYVYKDTPRPYIYPLYAPNGEMITRNYPMKSGMPGESTDHPHHRSFWIGFGDVNGIDFWAEGEKTGKIVQTSIDFEPASPGYWGIHTKNEWIGPDGKKVCDEERRYSFLSCDYGTLISTAIILTAMNGDVKLGDTKEGFFAIRLAPTMQLKDGKGHIINSEGNKDDACWGKRARWCDYTGEVNGKVCGVTIFDTPSNYNYPTYWHVRDYGLFAANPFGGKAFTNDAEKDSSYTIRYGHSLRLVYIVLIHDGNLDAQTLNAIADQVAGRGRGSAKEPVKANSNSAATKPAGSNLVKEKEGKSAK